MFQYIMKLFSLQRQYYISIVCSIVLCVILTKISIIRYFIIVILSLVYFISIFEDTNRIYNAKFNDFVAPIDGIVSEIAKVALEEFNETPQMIKINPKFGSGYFLCAPISGTMKYEIIYNYYTIYPFAFLSKFNLQFDFMSFNFALCIDKTIKASFNYEDLTCYLVHKVSSISQPFHFIDHKVDTIHVKAGQKLFGFQFDILQATTEIYFPINTEIPIQQGQTIIASETIIASK